MKVSKHIKNKGFALISTLSIMSLLVMLAIGMMSLATTENKVANATKYEMEARANARMALMIALGELQEAMGPDRRISANSNSLDTDPTTSVIEGVNLKHVMGAWRSIGESSTGVSIHDSGNTGDLNILAQEFKQSYVASGGKSADDRNGRFVNWLISGDAQQKRNVDYVSSVSIDDRNSVMMVGPKTFGFDSVSDMSAEEQEMLVRAPLVEIESNSGEGRYAWWVTGENMKAKVTLSKDQTNDQDGDRIVAAAGAPTMNPKVISKKSGQQGFTNVDPLNTELAGVLGKAFTQNGLLVLENGGSKLLGDDSKEFFHDVTVHSRGLLTNTKDGGVKRDFNHLFEHYNYDGSEGYFPDDIKGSPMFSGGPKWEDLHNYYSIYKETFDDGTDKPGTHIKWEGNIPVLVPFRSSENVVEIRDFQKYLPVLTKWQWIMAFSAVSPNEVANGELAKAENFDPSHKAFISVSDQTLDYWNPYNVAMELPVGRQLQLQGRHNGYAAEIEYSGSAFAPASGVKEGDFGEDIGGFQAWKIPTKGNNTHNITSELGSVYQPGEVHNYSSSYTPADSAKRYSEFGSGGQNDSFITGRPFSLDGGYYLKNWGWKTASSGKGKNKKTQISDGAVGNPGTVSVKYRLKANTKTYQNKSLIGQWVLNKEGASGQGGGIFGGIYASPEGVFGGDAAQVKSGVLSTEMLNNGGSTPWSDSETLDSLSGGNSVKAVFTAIYRPHLLDPRDGIEPSASYGTKPKHHLFSNIWDKQFVLDNNKPLLTWHSPYAFVMQNNISEASFETNPNNARYGFAGASDGSNGLSHAPVREIPIQPMTSMAQLQHAGLGHPKITIITKDNRSSYPSLDKDHKTNNSRHFSGTPDGDPIFENEPFVDLAFSNSWAHPMIDPTAIEDLGVPAEIGVWHKQEHHAYAEQPYHDKSWKSNSALMDSWFFSSIAPQQSPLFASQRSKEQVIQDALDGKPLPNSRYYINEELTGDQRADLQSDLGGANGYETVAAGLVCDGAFNVNSTSKYAWKAFLTSLDGYQLSTYDPDDSADFLDDVTAVSSVMNGDRKPNFPVSRFTLPNGNWANESDSEFVKNRWKGARSLTEQQVDDLAEKIVEEVKERGPFLSLGEFLNRRLESVSEGGVSGVNDTNLQQNGLKGALQEAIDKTDINADFDNTSRLITSSSDLEVDGQALPYVNKMAALGSVAEGAPGYVTQADLLMPLAPLLRVRDDVFTIRAYGDSRDSKGNIKAKAWCEAIVQRSINFVDSSDAADTQLFDLAGDPISNALSATNERYGRKLNIVGFRWLNSAEAN